MVKILRSIFFSRFLTSYNGNNDYIYFTPLIIGYIRHMYPTEIEIRNVTMKNAPKRGGTTLTHLLVLTSIRRAEVTNVTIMNNRRGALALFDSSVVLRGHITLSNNSAINGGGIALYGNSFISLKYRSRLEIINNSTVKTRVY